MAQSPICYGINKIEYYGYMTFNTTAPSLPPTDVRFIAANSTSVQLSWQPPLLIGQNGIIQQYHIRVIEEETMRPSSQRV